MVELLEAGFGGHRGPRVTIFCTVGHNTITDFWSFMMFLPKGGLAPSFGYLLQAASADPKRVSAP